MGTRAKEKRLPSQPQGILRIFLHSVYFLSTPGVLLCLINTDISRSCCLVLLGRSPALSIPPCAHGWFPPRACLGGSQRGRGLK